MLPTTSPRLSQTSDNDLATSQPLEAVNTRSRNSPVSQRPTRRSNSAMSTSRTRGSASKEIAEVVEHLEPDGNGPDMDKDTTLTGEPEDEEEAEDNSGSGESSNSTATTNTRSRRSVGSKRRRGGSGAAATSRARAAKVSQASAAEDLPDDGKEGEASAIKAEVDDEKGQQSQAKDGSPGSDAEESSMSRSNSRDEGKLERQRSVSGFKELAGLGLKTLGDGEQEPLVPRRTRRGAISPQDGSTQPHEGEGDKNGNATEPKEEPHEGALAEEPLLAAEEETAEEGVTRCLCGSADENVGLMIQCETCKCWQHCICMGMRTEEDCPDVYFCEQCRPEQHIALLRLLGVLPASRQIKKGGKIQSGRVNAKDAAKDLKEAKEAVLTLAKENEKRRKEGREPVTGWSVAQELEHQQMQLQLQENPSGARQLSGGPQHKRQPSEARVRSSRSQSRDEMTVPKSPPKRRSTMNSRDSAYGWESIPAHLLNGEDEEGILKEDSEGGARKRKRSGPSAEDGERHSPSPNTVSSNAGQVHSKRRRTSSAIDTIEERGLEDVEAEEDGPEEAPIPDSQGSKKVQKAKANREQEASKPKHPNQYTARRAAAAAAAAAAVGMGVGGSSSPSPSPSKHRLQDGSRRTTSLRDVINNGNRTGTPTPQNDYLKSSNPGAMWGMPDHLSHMSFLLPSSTGPEPLKINTASTKGMPSTSNSKGAPSTATKDSKTDRIIQASPQPYQIIALSEPNTKIKYPGKRTTMGEMKKRVRNILDFVSRLQIESAERERRMKFLGINKDVKKGEESIEGGVPNISNSAEGSSTGQISQEEEVGHSGDTAAPESLIEESKSEVVSAEIDQDQDTEMKAVDGEEQQNGDESSSSNLQAPTTLTSSADDVVSSEIAATTAPVETDGNQPAIISSLKRFTNLDSTSMSLVDELTRELLSFQQRYGTGTSASALMASSGGTF